MQPLREILQNATSAHRLQRRFYWLTTCVGFLGVAVGIGFMVVVSSTLASMLGISIERPLLDQPHGAQWLFAFFLSIPVAIYLGAVLVAGSFAAAMVALGKLSTREAVLYALLSRYPADWFKA